MNAVTVLYFASLQERAGRSREELRSAAADLAALYVELDARHGLGWPQEHLRVALDGRFAQWRDRLHDGAEVAFIPPVSGG